MRKDPKNFRERFKHWKETGEYLLPGSTLPDTSSVESSIPYPMLTSRDYDDARAYLLGYFDEAGATGHLWSNDRETGRILKSPTHPTISKAIWGDMSQGYDVINNNGLYYSKPSFIKQKIDKLPGYDDGKDGFVKTYVNQWGVDEEGNVRTPSGDIQNAAVVLDDIYVTPKGNYLNPPKKKDYSYTANSAYHPEDVPAYANALTGGFMLNLSPTQWLRRGYDAATGNLTADSWFGGNAGIVSNTFEEEHPYLSMGANALVDGLALGGAFELRRLKLKPIANNTNLANTIKPVVKPEELLTKPITLDATLVKPEIASPYQIADYPGYQLRNLMRGNPLEKQISKTGTINVNNIRSHFTKGSEIERAVVDKVLASELFAGQKTIDYNAFRKAVQDELITYKRVPSKQWEDYGIKSLGFEDQATHDAYNIRFNAATGEFEQVGEFTEFKPNYQLNTFTFKSPRIPIGNSTHYDFSTLGHSRTYTTVDQPDILHVMESQSDWAQQGIEKTKLDVSEYNIRRELIKGDIEGLSDEYLGLREKFKDPGISDDELLKLDRMRNTLWNSLLDRRDDLLRLEYTGYRTPQSTYLSNNYMLRQLQENLKYAAEHGLTKMRYPTPETAARIEGYLKGFTRSEESDNIQKQIKLVEEEYDKLVNLDRDPFDDKDPVNIRLDELVENLRTLRQQFDDAIIRAPRDYSPEHKTILKKYADFPKLYRKLYKNADVRTVTDTKGNTWYEVDVPKDYLNQEWMYSLAPWTIGGAGLGLSIPTLKKK